MTEPVPSDENLKKVRERVMQLAREVEQMSGQDMAPPVFFQEFLVRVVTAIGARAGIVWLIDEGGRLGLVAQVNLEQTGLRERPGALALNEKLLVEVLQTGEARTLTHGGEAQLPTEHVLVLSALHKEKKCVGVVELFQRPDVPVKAQSGYMQFLEQMCGYASRFIEGRRRNQGDSADLKNQFWTDFEQFTLRLQRSLVEQEVADAAASDGRSLLGCDRLSVVARKGKAIIVRAVSGQSSVNQRANLIVAMSKLARRVIEMGETLVYTGKIDGLAPQIEEPLAAFVQESGSRMVMLIPTFENEALVREQGEEADRERKKKRPKATGCLVVEQIAESEPLPQLEQRAELLADHVGAALWNSRQHGRILGLSLWKLMGKGLEWFRGRKLMITLAVVAVIAVVSSAMAFIRLDYPVKASGTLMPSRQHAVFATWDGHISREGLKIDGGHAVSAGDILIELENNELNNEIDEAKAAVQKHKDIKTAKKEEKDSAMLNRNNNTADSDQSQAQVKRLDVELTRIEGEILAAELHLRNLEKRRTDRLTIKAQASGTIPNFQLRQLLEDRPVKQGDHLFDIMDESGPWRLEVMIPESKMGHILRAQRERCDSGQGEELPGEFTMASYPEFQFPCRVTEVATRSTTDTEDGTVFELIAVPDKPEELPEKSIGLEVDVRITTVKVSLFYWCFGDVIDEVRKYFWL